MNATSLVSIEDPAVNKTDSLESGQLVAYVRSTGAAEIHHIYGRDVIKRAIGRIARRHCVDIVPDARVSTPTALLQGDFDELIEGAAEATELQKAGRLAKDDPDTSLRMANLIDSNRKLLERIDIAKFKEGDNLPEELDTLFSGLSAIASDSPSVYDVVAEPDGPNIKAVQTLARLLTAIPLDDNFSAGDLALGFETKLQSVSAKRASISAAARNAIPNEALDAAAALSLLETNMKRPIESLVIVIGDLSKALRSKEIPEEIARLTKRHSFDLLITNPVSPALIDFAIESYEFHNLTATFAWTPPSKTLESLIALGERFSPKPTIGSAASVAFFGTLPHHGRNSVVAAAWLGLRGRLDARINPLADLFGPFNPTFGGYDASSKQIYGIDDMAFFEEFSDAQRLMLAEGFGWNTLAIEDTILLPFRSRTRSSLKDWQQADASRGVRLITAAIRQSFRRLVGVLNEISREIEAQKQLDAILGQLRATDVINIELSKSITSTGRRLDLVAKIRYIEALETVNVLRMVQAV